jgi:hypothetical protein
MEIFPLWTTYHQYLNQAVSQNITSSWTEQA